MTFQKIVQFFPSAQKHPLPSNNAIKMAMICKEFCTSFSIFEVHLIFRDEQKMMKAAKSKVMCYEKHNY